MIRSGWAKVSAKIHGREQIVAIRGPGDVIGERSANTVTGVRSATVTALDEVHALVLSADQFADVLAECPAALEGAKRLDKERREEDGARRSLREPTGTELELAELVLALARRCGTHAAGAATIKLPMSHKELASWANDSPHAVTRYLRSWRENGVVLQAGRHVVVIDVGALERMLHRMKQNAEAADLGRGHGPLAGLAPSRALVRGVATMLDFNGVLTFQGSARTAAKDMSLAWRDVTQTFRAPAAIRPDRGTEPGHEKGDHGPDQWRDDRHSSNPGSLGGDLP